MESEDSENKFKCPYCFFTFSLHRELLNHTIRWHKNHPEFKIKCIENGCDKTFTKSNSYNHHMARNHRDNNEPQAERVDENLGNDDHVAENNFINHGNIKSTIF